MKTKLIDNNALIVKADKGNTLVIMDTDSYSDKVHDFISNNNIKILNSDPTELYVRELNNCINKCINLFYERTRRYFCLLYTSRDRQPGSGPDESRNKPISVYSLKQR